MQRLSAEKFDHPEVRRIFMRDAANREEFKYGQLVTNPELAQTFSRLAAHGVDEFYRRGATRDALLRCMDRAGGLITAADLAAYAPRWSEPVGVSYRGHWVTSPPAPCHGVQTLLTLGLLEGCAVGARGSAETLHLTAEAIKLAAADRAMWNQRPEGQRATAELLSPAYLAHRRKLIGRTAADSPTNAAMYDPGTPAGVLLCLPFLAVPLTHCTHKGPLSLSLAAATIRGRRPDGLVQGGCSGPSGSIC
eukprot:SAG22_NODE_96_length_20771_cov_33.186018_12_plen_249_part_00